MRPRASAFPPPPLSVWVGPMRYVSAPRRDGLVGYGRGIDVPLGPPGNAAAPHPDVVLRFTGSHWVAIETSPRGMFVNGWRVATIDIPPGPGAHDRRSATRPAAGFPYRPPRRSAGAAAASRSTASPGLSPAAASPA